MKTSLQELISDVWTEFLVPTFGFDRRNWLLIDAAFGGLGVAFAYLTNSVEKHVWSPQEAYFLVLGMLVLDFVLGTAINFKKEGWITHKAIRWVAKVVTYTLLLSVAFNMAKYDNFKLYFWLPEMIFFVTTGFLFTGLIKKAAVLGLIPRAVGSIIIHNIDRRLEKFNESEPQTAPNDLPANPNSNV